MDGLAFLQQVLELGWPAIVLLAILMLWREYRRKSDQLVTSLQEERDMWRRQSEVLLGIVLDREKLQFPRRSEMREFDDTSPRRPTADD